MRSAIKTNKTRIILIVLAILVLMALGFEFLFAKGSVNPDLSLSALNYKKYLSDNTDRAETCYVELESNRQIIEKTQKSLESNIYGQWAEDKYRVIIDKYSRKNVEDKARCGELVSKYDASLMELGDILRDVKREELSRIDRLNKKDPSFVGVEKSLAAYDYKNNSLRLTETKIDTKVMSGITEFFD